MNIPDIIPWLDLAGLFLMLAGFIIGLGAVTVIDLHGFLGRKSSYWTVATTRAHKVTKPLIWFGMTLAVIGGSIFYRNDGLTGTAMWHAVLAVVLVINGLFLSFYVSPFLLRREKEGKDSELLPDGLQRAIVVSFMFSFLGWWSSVALLVWNLVVVR